MALLTIHLQTLCPLCMMLDRMTPPATSSGMMSQQSLTARKDALLLSLGIPKVPFALLKIYFETSETSLQPAPLSPRLPSLEFQSLAD